MEQTLGKRIAAARKGHSLTQEALAERLGVTAQAVSKWENDQSCPDIAMLPKLAEIFGVTTDTLLGVEKKEVLQGELVEQKKEDEEPEGLHIQNGRWEFKWDGGRKSSVGIAVWVLLMGTLLLVSHFVPYVGWGLWELVWTSALFVFGIFGLYPKFSFFRLGCAFFGGYFLLDCGGLIRWGLGMSLIVPIVLLLFGLSLLFDAFRKPEGSSVHFTHNGNKTSKSYFDAEGERFSCGTCFGEDTRLVCLPRLSGGQAEVSFGELTVDLSGCEEIADGCQLELNCTFGQLELLVPKKYRVEPNGSTSFAAMEVKGQPDPEASATISVDCKVSFGEIEIKYV